MRVLQLQQYQEILTNISKKIFNTIRIYNLPNKHILVIIQAFLRAKLAIVHKRKNSLVRGELHKVKRPELP